MRSARATSSNALTKPSLEVGSDAEAELAADFVAERVHRLAVDAVGGEHVVGDAVGALLRVEACVGGDGEVLTEA